MIKLLSFLTAMTIGFTGTISLATYLKESNQATLPGWVNQMIANNPNQIGVGYDHYLLINKKHDKTDFFQQRDWMDFSQNKNLYLYLPEANNIDEAVQNIKIDDSASSWTIGIQNPVTWTKVNSNTYTNNRFITQDTTVAGISLMKNQKFQAIKNSDKWNELSAAEKNKFEEWGAISASRQGKKQDWWSANHWEKNLATEKNLFSSWSNEKDQKFSQLDLYQRWINQEMIGMNVPLSLIEKDSFTLQQTNVRHLFRFSSTIMQVWNDNNGIRSTIATPHWGFTLKITDGQDVVFQTPQIINLQDAFKEETINDYLVQKKYFSFNSQADNKFKNNYLIDYPRTPFLNGFLILPISAGLLALMLLFNPLYFANWTKSFIYQRKNKLKELNNGQKA